MQYIYLFCSGTPFNFYFSVSQVEWLLWGSVRRQHMWGFWRLYWRCDGDVRSEQSPLGPLQHHPQSCWKRITSWLLDWRQYCNIHYCYFYFTGNSHWDQTLTLFNTMKACFLYYIHVNYSKPKVHSKKMLFFFYFNNNSYINLLSHIPVSSSVQFIL